MSPVAKCRVHPCYYEISRRNVLTIIPKRLVTEQSIELYYKNKTSRNTLEKCVNNQGREKEPRPAENTDHTERAREGAWGARGHRMRDTSRAGSHGKESWQDFWPEPHKKGPGASGSPCLLYTSERNRAGTLRILYRNLYKDHRCFFGMA
jgi:hypothetical protein